MFNSSDIIFQCLDESIELDDLESTICILGFEQEWCNDVAADRLALNRLRAVSSFNIYILIVSHRDGANCTPSIVVADY